MRKQRRLFAYVVVAVLAIALVATGCKKEGQPTVKPAKTEKQAPDTEETPKEETPVAPVEAFDLEAIRTSLNDLSDEQAALKNLATLAEAVAGTNPKLAVPKEQAEQAEKILLDATLARMLNSALHKSDPKAIAAAIGLDAAKITTPADALLALGKMKGTGTPVDKATRLVAWLTAEPQHRAALPAPQVADWKSFTLENDAPAITVRTAMLDVVSQWLDNVQGAKGADRAKLTAAALAPFLCANCGTVTKTDMAEQLAAALYHAGNRGYVCDAAAAQLADKPAHAFPAALASSCKATDYGLTEQKQLETLTAENHLLVKALSVAVQAAKPAPADKGALSKLHAEQAKSVTSKLAKVGITLRLPWLPVPPAEQAAAGSALVPPAHMSATGPQSDFLPFETLVIDESGVATALRPAVSVRHGIVVFEDAGMAFPGKQVIAIDKIEASDKTRAEAAKAAKEKVADKDVITEVVAGLKATGAAAAPLAARLAPKTSAREPGKATVVLTVDTAAPAWLLRRSLASAQAAGYAYQLVHKPEAGRLAGDAVIPVVFRDTATLPEGLAVPTHKRPIIVSVEEKQIRVFPPDRKLKGAAPKTVDAPAVEWPEGTKQTRDKKRKLFSVDYVIPTVQEPMGAAVAQIVRKLQTDRNAGNVVYLVANGKANAGRFVEIADALTRIPGGDIPIDALAPDVRCEGPDCPHQVVVWFPKVRLPEMKDTKIATSLGPPGFCSKPGIARVVKSRQGRLRYCYESELQMDPGLRGKMTVRFVIGTDGSVMKAGISGGTLKNKRVKKCVLSTFKKMRFDKPDGGVCDIRWPLTFQP